MIMIRLMGGLGNQMFQYAFGRFMSIKYNTELVLDQTLLLDKSSPHEISTHRKYDLDIFNNLHFRWAKPAETFRFNGDPKAGLLKKIFRKLQNSISPKRLVIQQNNFIYPHYFSTGGDTCFAGRWQSYLFFKDQEAIIKKDFTLNSPPLNSEVLIQQINSTESVCVHIRRGDLLTSPLYSKVIGALDLSYYTSAISQMDKLLTDPAYFVFSDDIDWCKQNLKTNSSVTYVGDNFSGTKAEGHLYLMIQCKHFILSNSTFAWWGAFLSSNNSKKVIYPKNWYKDETLSNPEMSPPEWMAM